MNKSITGDITPLPWKDSVGSQSSLNMNSGKKTNERPYFTINTDFHSQKLITNGPEAKIAEVFYDTIALNIGGKIFEHRIGATEAQKNMNYIVKACNEYPSLKLLNNELVEALEEFISLTKNISNDFNFPILQKAKKLINKAKQ